MDVIKKNKNILFVVGVIILILIICILLFKGKEVEAPLSIDQLAIDSTITSTEDVALKAKSISYVKALELYKDKRIQLGSGNVCEAIPNNVTYKNNTTIMIDNRSSVLRTIKIDATYTIKPYGFKLIKLSSAKLPVTWLVDCNKQQNVATILLQK